MKINSISMYNSQTFCAKRGSQIVTPAMLEEMDRKALKMQMEHLKKAALVPTVTISGVLMTLDEFFAQKGITYYSEKNDNINIACSYNGGYYTIPGLSRLEEKMKKDHSFKSTLSKSDKEEPTVKEYFANSLSKNTSSFAGLQNYLNCVSDLKRQDLVMKGIKIHTYELNTGVTEAQQKMAAKNFSKFLNRVILPEDLFYLENDAFYYDKNNKTVYGVNIYKKGEQNIHPAFRVCQFDTDENGYATGYTVKDWNIYYRKNAEEVYKEQSAPSEDISQIVDWKNNKHLAEAFRFGNNEPDYKINVAAPRILEHLENRVKIKYPKWRNIKYVRFYDKNYDVVSRFSYYDSSTGRSFIYDTDGKYKYQMEYNKDDFGNIIACGRF